MREFFRFFDTFSRWGGGGICRLPAKSAKDHAGGVADSSRRLSASDTTGLRSQNSLLSGGVPERGVHGEDSATPHGVGFVVLLIRWWCCAYHRLLSLKPPASEQHGTLLWIDLKQLSFAIVTTPIPLLLSKNRLR